MGEFITRGYDATSMEDLSRAAGITKSSFYHHFSGKEALLRAALERALDGLFAILDRAARAPAPPLERLRHIVRGQVAVLVGGAALRHAAAAGARQHRDRAVGAGAPPRRSTRTSRPWCGRPSRRESCGQDVEPALAARLLSGLVNSVVEWARPDRDSSHLPDVVARAAFEGILPAADRG